MILRLENLSENLDCLTMHLNIQIRNNLVLNKILNLQLSFQILRQNQICLQNKLNTMLLFRISFLENLLSYKKIKRNFPPKIKTELTSISNSKNSKITPFWQLNYLRLLNTPSLNQPLNNSINWMQKFRKFFKELMEKLKNLLDFLTLNLFLKI